ncbi:MAG: serine hydroxymethyltransferase [Candidatus Velamenicoccus archaeovorus]
MRDHVADWDSLQETDPEIAAALAGELERERGTLRLIASENYTSPAVLAALGSTMTDKYAEGYPGRRYYGGCRFVDVVEELAVERAKALFGAEHANVQPHAGAQANLAVFGAFLEPFSDDKVLGLVLAHGGHLTHGSPVNVSGMWFSFVGYEVDPETEQLDMDRVRDLAVEHRPRLILAGYTAYPRTIDFAAFRQIADEVGALLWVDASHFIGLSAGGAYPNPVPYADVVTFTTHKTLRGPRGAVILCKREHARALDKAVFPMMQGGPLEHVIAAKAVALKEAMQPAFTEYAHRTVRTARALAQGLADEGLRIVSGGTDSHLALADLRPIGVSGRDAELLCDEVGIALNKNGIPFDPMPPANPSGIRVGTPGPATLGMDEPEMKEVAAIVGTLLRHPDDEVVKASCRARVRELMVRFPVYPDPARGTAPPR